MWGQIAAAGIGALGSYLGNKTSSHANDPVNPADAYLPGQLALQNDVWSGGQGLQQYQYAPDGTVAPWNSMMTGSVNGLYNNPTGYGAQNTALGYGNQAYGTMANQLDNPNQAFQYSQGTFDQSMANLMPAMQGSYDAATRDNNRNLNWNQLPGLNMGGSQAGQQGSTKVGQQSALMQSNNMDRNADIGASMYQNAVNQSQDAAMRAGGANLGAQQANFGRGFDALNSGFDMYGQNIRNDLMGGQLSQGYDDRLWADRVNEFNFNQEAPYSLLQRQQSLVGSPQGGNFTTGGASGPNAWELGTQGAQFGLGLYGAGQDAGWWGTGTGTGSSTTGGMGGGYGNTGYDLNAPWMQYGR